MSLKKNLIAYLESNSSDAIGQLGIGFGSLKELLVGDTTDKEILRIRELVKARYGEKGLDQFKSSLLTSYYTPIDFLNPVLDSIEGISTGGLRILEPAAGVGSFLDGLRGDHQVVAIEKDLVAGDILSAKNKEKRNVEVIVGGYERFQTATKFDLIVSNVPFGNYRVFDQNLALGSPVEKRSMEMIHNFYMVKSCGYLADGGIMAMIVPSGFSDSKGNSEFREYLMSRCDLVFFNRLPVELFKATGTKASSDLLVLQRRFNKRKVDMRPYEEMYVNSLTRDKVTMNEVIATHTRLGRGVMARGGQYGNESLMFEYSGTVAELGSEVAIDLQNAFERQKIELRGEFMSPNDLLEQIELPDYYREGNLVVRDDKVLRVADMQPIRLVPTDLEVVVNVQLVRGLISIKDSYKELMLDIEAGRSIELPLEKLNRAYDEFVQKHSFLNDSEVANVIENEADGHILTALEVDEDEHGFRKAEVFFESFYRAAERKVEDLPSAILHSLSLYNQVDLEYISEVTGLSENDVLSLGIDQGRLYQDFINGERVAVTSEDFLSGDVVGRIRRLDGIDPLLFIGGKERHMEALRSVEPVRLPVEVLDLQLGERWIDKDVYEAFAASLFKVKSNVVYIKSQDSFRVSLEGYSSDAANKYSSPSSDGTYNGNKVMEYAMLDLVPEITKSVVDPDGNIKKVADVEKIRQFEKVAEGIRKEFKSFVSENAVYKERLEDKYHELFNNVVLRDYDGSHLTFPGLKGFEPKQHQKDGVWMILQRNGGLIDHRVGKGKTLVIAMAAMEMKRLGLVKKPMALGIKANTDALYNDFRRAYPHAKLLYPTDKDFEKKNRKIFFQKVASENWDCVLLTHDQFGKIKQSVAVTRSVIEQQIHALQEDMDLLQGDRGIGRKELKGLETRKLNLEAKLEELSSMMGKDHDVVDFVQMGVDHLLVDESHTFKNLAFSTRHTRVSGLGDPKGSQRALNMLIAIKTLHIHHGGDKGVTFLSGTTISNSLNELYSLFQYMKPSELERKQLPTFDAWASVYAVRSSEYEYSVTGEVKRKDRFREYVKVPELARMYREMSHVNHTKENEPELNNVMVTLDPSDDQLAFNDELIVFARSRGKEGNVGKIYTDKESTACMLIATGLSKKSSTDMRLIDPLYDRNDHGKIMSCARNIMSKYNEWNYIKGTQMVFCDIGVPNKIQAFSVYSELKQVLVEMGMPAHEIAFMQDHNTKKQKSKIIEAFNKGNIRVLMGSTQVLGTGINGQERGVAMHSLELPWKPSDLEQRTGRFIRPGNWAAVNHLGNKVDHFIYATKKSLDVFQFQLLETKQNFINQIKDASITDRRIDEGSIDIEGGMNFAEYRAMLVGDDSLLERAKLDRKYKDLLRDKDGFHQRKNEAALRLQDAEKRLGVISERIPFMEKDLAMYSGHLKGSESVEKFAYSTPLIIDGFAIRDVREAGEALLSEREKLRIGDERQVGSFGSFTIHMKRLAVESYTGYVEASVYVKGAGEVLYTYGNGVLSDVPGLAGKYVVNALSKIEPLLDKQKELRENLTNDIVSLKELLLLDQFPGEGELHKLREEIATIDARLDKQNDVSGTSTDHEM